MVLKKILLVLAVLTVLTPFSALAEESRFFSTLSDIPLMPGLYEVTRDSLSFDKAEGRIVETAAASETLNAGQIRDFYASSLPQLGWAANGKDAYTRNGEILTLRLESKGALNVVHLSLSPVR
ncbi:MAG: hypothetical protein JWO78_789 [Micavibrio sp.]|nr:hypothetical protein [Micavibrio sp.]